MSERGKRVTKAMLAEFATRKGYTPRHVTEVWVALARIDRLLKEKGSAGLDVEAVGTPPARSTPTSGNAGEGVTAQVSLESLRAIRHQLTPRLVRGYGVRLHEILTSWLDSLADE